MADTAVASDPISQLDQVLWGVAGPYWISETVGAIVYFDTLNDIKIERTDDGGVTWGNSATFAGTSRQFNVVFDQELPNDSGNLLHIAWLDTAGACYYQNYNISTEATGTKRTVDATVTPDGTIGFTRCAIGRSRSGNLMVAFTSNVAGDLECYRSTDGGLNWVDRADVFENGPQQDQVALFPANTGDDDDFAAIFHDISSKVLSIKMYDESSNTWTETAIVTLTANIKDFTHWDASLRHSDGHILLAVHNESNAAGDDLITYDLTVDSIASPTVTAKTNIFTNQAASAQAAVVINQQNDDVYVAYLKGGTWNGIMDVVYHISTDGMSSWGGEQAYSETAADDIRLVQGGRTVGDSGGFVQWAFFNQDLLTIYVNLVNDVAISAAPEPPAADTNPIVPRISISVPIGARSYRR